MTQWKTIDSAPKDYTAILLMQGETVGEGCYSNHLAVWEFFNPAHVMRREPTHWAALPASIKPAILRTKPNRGGGQ